MRKMKLLMFGMICALLFGCAKENGDTSGKTKDKNDSGSDFVVVDEREQQTDTDEDEASLPDVEQTTLSDEQLEQYKEKLMEKLENVNEDRVVSTEMFLTCKGSDFYPYPEEIFGIVYFDYLDLDGDMIDEGILLKTKRSDEGDAYSGEVWLQIYKIDESGYVNWASKKLTDIEFCMQQRIALYQKSDSTYGVVVDKAYWGSYTRASGKIGQVYSISESLSEIESVGTLEVNSVEGGDEAEIEKLLKEHGVPKAENCASYNNGDDVELCVIEHINYDDIDYENIENYLRITSSQLGEYNIEAAESADRDLLDSIYSACTVVSCDPEIYDEPTQTGYIDMDVMQNTDWGKTVFDVLGVTSFSQLEDKLQSDASDGTIKIYMNADGSFQISAGTIVVGDN